MRLETSKPGFTSERSDTTELDIWRSPLRLTCAFLLTLGVGVCGFENPALFLQGALGLKLLLIAMLWQCEFDSNLAHGDLTLFTLANYIAISSHEQTPEDPHFRDFFSGALTVSLSSPSMRFFLREDLPPLPPASLI